VRHPGCSRWRGARGALVHTRWKRAAAPVGCERDAGRRWAWRRTSLPPLCRWAEHPAGFRLVSNDRSCAELPSWFQQPSRRPICAWSGIDLANSPCSPYELHFEATQRASLKPSFCTLAVWPGRSQSLPAGIIQKTSPLILQVRRSRTLTTALPRVITVLGRGKCSVDWKPAQWLGGGCFRSATISRTPTVTIVAPAKSHKARQRACLRHRKGQRCHRWRCPSRESTPAYACWKAGTTPSWPTAAAYASAVRRWLSVATTDVPAASSSATVASSPFCAARFAPSAIAASHCAPAATSAARRSGYYPLHYDFGVAPARRSRHCCSVWHAEESATAAEWWCTLRSGVNIANSHSPFEALASRLCSGPHSLNQRHSLETCPNVGIALISPHQERAIRGRC